MTENTLEAFIVKRRKVLLPKITDRGQVDCTAWCSSKRTVNKEVLIEAKEETASGYCLYGTEIPIIFCYPRWSEMTNPNMKTCIGVEARQWEVSSSMKRSHPDGEFHYKGKYITDEDIIAWLENEQNIESMKRVREWAIQYGEECKKVQEAIHQREVEAVRSRRYHRQAEAERQTQKIKEMVNRNNELVARYQ